MWLISYDQKKSRKSKHKTFAESSTSGLSFNSNLDRSFNRSKPLADPPPDAMADHHNAQADTMKGDLKAGASVGHGNGHSGKIPYVTHLLTFKPIATEHSDTMDSYPKHVWSPAGGWYAQPKNWKANTAILSAVAFSIVAVTWKFSADHEERPRMPEPGRFYPSR